MSSKYIPPKLNKDALKAAAHEIVRLCANEPERLNMVELHTTLFIADMATYMQGGGESGEPVRAITGCEYLAEDWGWGARYLEWALLQLKETGCITWTKRHIYVAWKHDFGIGETAPPDALNDADREMLSAVVDFVCFGRPSVFSQLRLGWWRETVKLGETFPYPVAFCLLPRRRPTAKDIAFAEEHAGRLGLGNHPPALENQGPQPGRPSEGNRSSVEENK